MGEAGADCDIFWFGSRSKSLIAETAFELSFHFCFLFSVVCGNRTSS